jgi:hypothetical protein
VSNKDLVDLTMRLAQRIEDAPAESNATPAKVAQANLGQVQPALPAVQDGAFFPTTTSAKQRKTADELAAMIAADLREVKGCPKRGLSDCLRIKSLERLAVIWRRCWTRPE